MVATPDRQIVTDERVPRFVGALVGRIIYPPFTAMGIERDGKIVAGVVFNCFDGADIHVTVAGHGWTRAFLRSVGNYLFEQIGVARCTAITEQAPVVGLALRLGGQIEGTLRDHFGPGRDGILIGILKDERKF